MGEEYFTAVAEEEERAGKWKNNNNLIAEDSASGLVSCEPGEGREFKDHCVENNDLFLFLFKNPINFETDIDPLKEKKFNLRELNIETDLISHYLNQLIKICVS